MARENTCCWNMKKRIVGFHLDEEQHWVAELECGHNQHVRHNPPWTIRPWVITEQGRNRALGHELNCTKCDVGAPPDQSDLDSCLTWHRAEVDGASAVVGSADLYTVTLYGSV